MIRPDAGPAGFQPIRSNGGGWRSIRVKKEFSESAMYENASGPYDSQPGTSFNHARSYHPPHIVVASKVVPTLL